MTGEGPDMKEYLERRKGDYEKSDLAVAELLSSYYKGQLIMVMERHRRAFEYMNGLYQKVLGKLRGQAKENRELKELRRQYSLRELGYDPYGGK